MKFCKDIPQSAYRCEFSVDVSRANLCQWLWGFARGWWRGEQSVRLNMWCDVPCNVYDNEVLVWPIDGEVNEN